MSDFSRTSRLVLSRAMNPLETLQGMLNFDGWEEHVHYRDRNGIGRSGLIGCMLGVVGGFHACLFLCLFCLMSEGFLRSVLVGSYSYSYLCSDAYLDTVSCTVYEFS